MRFLLDTSVIVAALNQKDRHHLEAVSLLKKARSSGHEPVLTNFVLAETYGLIIIRLGADIARRWLKENSNPVERVTKADEVRAREILLQYDDKDFSYVDATSFAVMERLGLDTAFAFDQHFCQYGWRIWGEGQ